jgi:hypothetical protein
MSDVLKGIVQDLRNSFDAHDRVAHEEAIQRLRRVEAVIPESGCTRGVACVCNQHAKAVCMYRLKS